MRYPFVEEEFETVRIIVREGASIARFGDGELRNALGGSCKCQIGSPSLSIRLKEILKNRVNRIDTRSRLLVGIPRSYGRNDLWRINSKKAEAWRQYERGKFVDMYDPSTIYYSAFITRPDSAPHIDCEEYWKLAQSIWKNRKVFIATGGKWKWNPELFDCVASVDYCNDFPSKNAFCEHEQILKRLLQVSKDTLMILSLGPEATVLAYDLTNHGYQALDLGHLEMFYRRGRFHVHQLFNKKDVVDKRDIGYRWIFPTTYLIDQWRCFSILDYGCGDGSFGNMISHLKVTLHEYDPGIKGKTECPKAPVDLVICGNVLHLIDKNMLANVLDHLNFLIGKVGLFIIPYSSDLNLCGWIETIEKDRKWESVQPFPLNDREFFGILVTK